MNQFENALIKGFPYRSARTTDENCPSAQDCRDLLGKDIESVSVMLSIMTSDEDAPPTNRLISEAAYVINNLNELREIFTKIADAEKRTTVKS